MCPVVLAYLFGLEFCPTNTFPFILNSAKYNMTHWAKVDIYFDTDFSYRWPWADIQAIYGFQYTDQVIWVHHLPTVMLT